MEKDICEDIIRTPWREGRRDREKVVEGGTPFRIVLEREEGEAALWSQYSRAEMAVACKTPRDVTLSFSRSRERKKNRRHIRPRTTTILRVRSCCMGEECEGDGTRDKEEGR